MLTVAAFTLASALMASAADFNVSVGFNNQLLFNPPSLVAQAGDNINFQFLNKNHSVTQSTFGTPCIPKPDGVDSGFRPVNTTTGQMPVWSMQVTNSTDPLWFFCAQTNPVSHCNMGMVFAVNAPPDKTVQQFTNNAMGSSGASASGGASGASGSATGVIPAPSTLPSSPVSGVSAPPAGSTSASSPSDAASGTGSASSPASTGAAVGLSPSGAFGVASLLAAVAGFML